VLADVALMLAAGLVADLVAGWLRLPRALLLIAAGLLLGPEALDLLQLPIESSPVQLVLTLGVALLLFHGGLGLDADVLRTVGVSLGMLALPGVFITAGVTGLVAAAAFGLPVLSGLLIGAVLAPTDPAVLISVFDRVRVRPKVAQTVVAESALNDPSGAVLAVALAAAVAGSATIAGTLGGFVRDVLLSAALGLVLGVLLGATISTRRFGVWRESAALAVLLVLSAGYVSIDSVGGSGYLGAFLAGLIAGNLTLLRLPMDAEHERDMTSFVNAVVDLVVIAVFLVLGANIQLDLLREYALPGLAVVLVLVLVARPLTVAACLLPDRRAAWTRQELLFIGWTRETGVVAAALASLLAAEGISFGPQLQAVVAIAVVVTLVGQASLKPWLSARLGLREDDPEIVERVTGPARPAAEG